MPQTTPRGDRGILTPELKLAILRLESLHLYDMADHMARELIVETLTLLNEVPALNKRRCYVCGDIAYHEDSRTPYVLCRKCGSQDTRRID
jgi:hypothetical protein